MKAQYECMRWMRATAPAARLALCLAVLVEAGVTRAAGADDYSAPANEAVRIDRTGERTVQLPPGSNVTRLPAQAPPPDGGTVYMIETEAGLVECTHRWYRKDECRAATFGKLRVMRAWVVKRGGTWWQCSLPSTDAKCLPYGQMFFWHTLM